MKVTGFRDPSIWKQGEWYYMTVGSGEVHVGGCVLLYRSKDLRNWEYLHQLTGGEWNGKPTPNPCDDGEMWECPDFFALDGGHVLIYSTMGKVFWQSGALSAEMKFTPRKSGLLDLGAFYAPKTQLDAKGRRILWGWIPERRGDDAMTKAGWSGMMSLPRVMNLDQDGSLRLTMLPELEALRVPIPAGVDKGTDQTRVQVIPKACGEFLHEVAGLETDFEIVLRAVNPATELLRVKYAASARSLTVDGHEIALGAADRPRLHGYVDGSVIEIIMNGTTGYTKRFYYDQAVAPDVEIELVQPKDGRIERAQVWGIKPISPNRLTTPA